MRGTVDYWKYYKPTTERFLKYGKLPKNQFLTKLNSFGGRKIEMAVG